MTKVELFEAIRRDKRVHGKGIRQIARERGVHRRMVREALESAIPRPRKPPEREPPVLTRELRVQIDKWLKEDRTAPRKQRHTARRIWKRLRKEKDFTGAESTVRRYVSGRRRELGASKDAFVPQTHDPGDEGEVDWYEAAVDFPWGRETAQIFEMRACFSGREFHMAFPRQTQRAFLEAHVAAFAYFLGVFAVVRYDNLKAAVVKVLRGRRRQETDRFVAMRSHYEMDSEFCRSGIDGAHEKGGVEGGVGRFRRSHLVPVPQVESYEALNKMLLDKCAEDDLRRVEGRPNTILEDWEQERAVLQPLPDAPFETADVFSSGVDSKGCVRVRTNRYSVPIRLANRSVEVRLHAQRLEMVHEGTIVATHLRQQGRHGIRLKLDHYLELLWHKPGALRRALPLRQARERNEWPPEYDQLWAHLRDRADEPEAARQMLAVVMMHRDHEPEDVHVAVGLALAHGCFDAGAISVLLRQLLETEEHPTPLADLGDLAAYERPTLGTTDYDQLLRVGNTGRVH